MSEEQADIPTVPPGDAGDAAGDADTSHQFRHTDEDRWQATWGRFVADSTPPPKEAPQPALPSGLTLAPQLPLQPPRAASAADLTSQTLLRPRVDVPDSGWRRALHRASGGRVNLGLSVTAREHAELMKRIATPVRGCHRIAVVSLKGGIGKTTTTACLGLTLARYRGDRVVAMDANPDAGTLAERLTGASQVTVRDLLSALDRISSVIDMSAYTTLTGRLQVLASDQDPEVSHAFNEQQYRAVADVLGRYFTLILTDSGTGLLHSAMAGTLALADSVVVVGAPSVDGASRAAKTLDWLVAHGHGELVSRSVAVISANSPDAGAVNRDVLRTHFAGRCRAVVEIPYDPHLAAGGQINMSELRPATTTAFLSLAGAVADGFHPTQAR